MPNVTREFERFVLAQTARATRVLGIIHVILGGLGVSILALTPASMPATGVRIGMIFYYAASVLVPGIAYSLAASHVRRGRVWAVIVVLVISSVQAASLLAMLVPMLIHGERGEGVFLFSLLTLSTAFLISRSSRSLLARRKMAVQNVVGFTPIFGELPPIAARADESPKEPPIVPDASSSSDRNVAAKPPSSTQHPSE